MDETLWSLMNVIGPVILLILLIWLVMRSRRRPNQTVDTTAETEAGTRAEYADEEQRRRDGTDGL
jgi:cytochrome c-type biogenesis protein CcmH/NrfF